MIETFRIGSRDIEKRYGGNLVLGTTGIEMHNHDGIATTGKNDAGKTPLLRAVAGLQPIRQSRQR